MTTCTLGQKYRDTITGYEGTATARTEYLGNSPSVRLERADETGKPEEEWFTESRLGEVEVRRVGIGP